MKWFSVPVVDFDCGQFNKEEWFDGIVERCDDMEAGDVLIVYDFGENGDLLLNIYKDEEYRGDDYCNIVRIYTDQLNSETKVMEPVDDTEDTYVTDGSLERELERIWNYENFSVL